MNLQLELSKFQREFLTKITQEKGAIMQGATQALAKEFQNRLKDCRPTNFHAADLLRNHAKSR